MSNRGLTIQYQAVHKTRHHKSAGTEGEGGGRQDKEVEPGMMETVLRALRTRNVRRPARLPISMVSVA